MRGDARRYFDEVVLPYDGKECLIWPFSTKNNGYYGQIKYDGKMHSVHRLVCDLVHGAPPTPKHHAAHECGKGRAGCVNPNHISWKTAKENNADKLAHGTHNRGERHGQAKLTEEDVREILRLKGLEAQRSLARRFGVSQTNVRLIHLGDSWSWIQPT